MFFHLELGPQRSELKHSLVGRKRAEGVRGESLGFGRSLFMGKRHLPLRIVIFPSATRLSGAVYA